LALVAVIFLHGQSSIGAVLSLSQTSPWARRSGLRPHRQFVIQLPWL